MSDFWGSILSALGIGGDNAQQQSPSLLPPSGGQGALGVTQAQIPSWDQYNKDRSSFGGILTGMLGHGIGPGLQEAFQPDSMAMQSYNAGLGQAQDVGIKGISIPRQQFMADVISGKRDGDTGKWLGEGPDPLLAQKQAQAASYAPQAPQAPQMPGQGTPVTGMSLLPPQGGAGGAGGGSAPAGPNLLAPKPASFNDMDATGIEKTLPPGLTGAVTRRDPTAFNDMDTTGMTAPPAPVVPAVVSGNGHPTFMGLPLPRGVTPQAARMALMMDPTGKGLLDIVKQGLTITNVRPGGAGINSYGDVVYQQPVLPQGQVYQNGQAVTVPGANQQHATLQGIDQGARASAEKSIKGFENVLQFGDLGMGGAGAGVGGGGGPKRTTGGPLSGPPIAGAAPPLTTKPMLPQGAGTTEPAESERGTVIPPVSEQTPIPRDAESLKTAIPEWQKTSAAWTSALNPGYQAEQRLQTIAEAFKKTESGSWATEKGAMAGIFKSLGIKATPEMLGDPAQVQIALHNNAVETLQQLKNFTAGTSTRSTQLEFKMLAENKEHPNLQPAANLDFLSQDIGAIRWQRALALDWRDAQKVGWRNPQDFEAAWGAKKPNSISTFVEGVRKEIGPLKGMDGSSAAPAAGVTHIWQPGKGIVPVSP